MGSPLIRLYVHFVVALAGHRTFLLRSWVFLIVCFILHVVIPLGLFSDSPQDFQPLVSDECNCSKFKISLCFFKFLFNMVFGYVGLPLDWNANTIVPRRSPLPSPLFSGASKMWYQKLDHITTQSITLSTNAMLVHPLSYLFINLSRASSPAFIIRKVINKLWVLIPISNCFIQCVLLRLR